LLVEKGEGIQEAMEAARGSVRSENGIVRSNAIELLMALVKRSDLIDINKQGDLIEKAMAVAIEGVSDPDKSVRSSALKLLSALLVLND